MPTITLDKKDVLSSIGKKISDEELKDRISMIGTDLESMDSKEIVVEIFPDRPDMLTAAGFSRALSSFMNIRTGLREYKVNHSDFRVVVDKKVDKVRPCVVAAIIKNIKLNDLIIQYLMQVQEKLHKTLGRNRKKISIGVYDFDNIEFPLVYTTKPRDFKFVPLEMQTEMSLNDILDKHPKGVDYAHLLNDFKEFPIWLDKQGQVLSMPPVINSEETKVTHKTKNLFIDVTGLDLNTCEQALNILVTALADRGGEIFSVSVGGKKYPKLENPSMKLDLDFVNKVLGLNLKQKDIKLYLERMGYAYSNGIAKIPCYRVDVLSQIDLVEDIAIAYGYENFKPEIKNFGSVAEEDDFERFKDKVCNILTGFGLIETNTYNLGKKEDQTKNMMVKLDLVEIENALNEEYNVMRAWMLPSLMDVLKNNKQYEYPQKIFEAGTVFTPEEITNLGMLICNPTTTYTEARQILDALLTSLNLEGVVKACEHESFIPGRVGKVFVRGKEIAFIGELHPEVLNNFSLENPVVGFELNLTDLFKLM